MFRIFPFYFLNTLFLLYLLKNPLYSYLLHRKTSAWYYVLVYYEYHLVGADSIPDINPLNPKYQYFIRAWKKLPLPLANTVGPLLAKNLG